jgi:hypothetical protein
MGIFDEIKDKVSEFVEGNPDKVEDLSDQGIDKAGDALDSATDGKFSDQVDQGQQIADDKIGE